MVGFKYFFINNIIWENNITKNNAAQHFSRNNTQWPSVRAIPTDNTVAHRRAKVVKTVHVFLVHTSHLHMVKLPRTSMSKHSHCYATTSSK
uniref:Uncharacterized protein n=1 Tax=Arundo donax TaxID=35708 RepID=A0A0A9CQG6_ARUDO